MNQPEAAVVTIRLSGEFDIATRDRLASLLRPAELADTAIIDMSETTYMDSTALSCLIHLKKQLLQRDGAVHLVGVRPNVRRVFTICKLDELFEIRDLETTR